MKRIVLSLFLMSVPAVAAAQALPMPTFIRQPGPQIYPKVNPRGNIAYRSGTAAQNFSGMKAMFRSSPTSSEVKLADGLPIGVSGTCCDARHLDLGESEVMMLAMADGANGPASTALLSQPLFRGLGGSASTRFTNPDNWRREGAAISDNPHAYAWSEHRNGQWDVVVSIKRGPPLAQYRFDTGLDDRQAAIDGELLAWTAVNQFAGWANRNTVMVKSLADDFDPRPLAMGRFPSVSYPYIAYEAYDAGTGASAIELHDYERGITSRVQTCDYPMRPVVAAPGGMARVYHFCPKSETLEVTVPALNCTLTVGGLFHRPDETEPSQYDAKGFWVVYSYFDGSGSPADDGEFDLAALEITNEILFHLCTP